MGTKACSGRCPSDFKALAIRETTVRTILLAAALVSASSLTAFAQTSPAPSTNVETPAVATPDTKNPTAPVEGANSFTEEQAKERLTEAGFTDVVGLKLDSKGVWRGTASKDGKSSQVELDYQGNIVAN